MGMSVGQKRGMCKQAWPEQGRGWSAEKGGSRRCNCATFAETSGPGIPAPQKAPKVLRWGLGRGGCGLALVSRSCGRADLVVRGSQGPSSVVTTTATYRSTNLGGVVRMPRKYGGAHLQQRLLA